MKRFQELRAEAATVRELIELLPPQNALDILCLRSRYEHLLQQASEAEKEIDPPRVDLFFSGQPVLGARGIDPRFASKVIDRYYEAVQAQAAKLRTGRLRHLGPIPMRDSHRLLIVDKLAGSVGFSLQAVHPDLTPEDAETLRSAIASVDAVIEGSLRGDDALSDAAVSTEERVLTLLKEFLETCRDQQARFRIAEPERSPIEARDSGVIRDAVERLATAKTTKETAQIGWLRGVLPDGHQFEFEFEEDGEMRVQRGSIDSEIDTAGVRQLQEQYQHKKVRAVFRVTQVGSNRRSRRYVLVRIEEAPNS